MLNSWFRGKGKDEDETRRRLSTEHAKGNDETELKPIRKPERVRPPVADNGLSQHTDYLQTMYAPSLVDPIPPNPPVAGENSAPVILHDPFSGKNLGTLVEAEGQVPDTPNQELWTHLSRVMAMQQNLAEAHMEMEGIGGERRKQQRRSQRTSEGEDDGVGVQEDEEVEGNRAREDEFAKLTSKFDGRKEAIDDIMAQLTDLSRALTTFHALQTPVFDFAATNSRSNSLAPPADPLRTPTSPTSPSPKPFLAVPTQISYTRSAPVSSSNVSSGFAVPTPSPTNAPPTLLHESPASMHGFTMLPSE